MLMLGGGAKLLFDLLFILSKEMRVGEMGIGDGLSFSNPIGFVRCLDEDDEIDWSVLLLVSGNLSWDDASSWFELRKLDDDDDEDEDDESEDDNDDDETDDETIVFFLMLLEGPLFMADKQVPYVSISPQTVRLTCMG